MVAVGVVVERAGYSVEEARKALGGIGRTLMYDLIKQGRVRAVKLGGRTIIPRTEIERVLDEGRTA